MAPLSGSGLAPRAALAVALFAGFYALGIGLVLLLFALPWAQIQYAHLDPAGMLCGAGGLWVSFALLPRFRRFEAPGQPLDPELYPALFDSARALASAAGQRVPDEIYLLPAANAFASRRPRWMGLRGVPILGIGLPLFEVMDPDELRSVIAHELGHHDGGDTRLGPFVYGTRRAIANALQRLDGSSFWLHLPFVAYGRLFLRLSQSVSRGQELHADALAARLCGAEATGRALARVHGQGLLWAPYWEQEVLPVINAGFLPPILEGYQRFIAEDRMKEALASAEATARKAEASPYDSHPSLPVRLDALGVSAPALKAAAPQAKVLLGDPARAERHVINGILRDPTTQLKPVGWEEVGETVWLPLWRKAVKSASGALSEVSPTSLPETLARIDDLALRMRAGPAFVSPEAERRRARNLLVIWLTVTLSDRGFRVHAPPAAPIACLREGEEIVAEKIVAGLLDGTLSAQAWQERCAALQL